ncbi:MAG: MCE family protein [Sphingobacteriales bacterium]|nr:MAG: MCE family protein [Sphingobacteriales bacterium]
MKTNASQKVKLGIFTVVGILLFVVGIFIIGSKKNMFGDTFLIYGTFKNVGGLAIGNNIRYAGITVGTVEDIRIVSDTVIRVDMLMQEQVRPFLKADALASIGSDGLMGDKLITIAPGSANMVQLLSGGSRIRTVNPLDFDKVLGQFTSVATNAEIITQELAGMAVQIREGDGTISKLLYTDDLSRSLEGTASNAEKITGSLAGIAAQIRSGKGSIGNLVYTDTLSNVLATAGATANSAMLTIQQGANGFSENMKALQGNYFLRGYFKKKARAEKEIELNAGSTTTTESIDTEMDEEELRNIIAEAQKALDAKKKTN